jgi:hypothetical protein
MKIFWAPAQQHQPQQDIQKIGQPVQASCSPNNDMTKVVTVVLQITTDLRMSEKDKIVVSTKMVHNLMKQNDC